MKALHYERYFFITTTLMMLSPPSNNYSNDINLLLQPFFCKNTLFLLLIIKFINYSVFAVTYSL